MQVNSINNATTTTTSFAHRLQQQQQQHQQQVQIGESVPSAITSIYSKLHKYAFEGNKNKLKKLLKENKGKQLNIFVLL